MGFASVNLKSPRTMPRRPSQAAAPQRPRGSRASCGAATATRAPTASSQARVWSEKYAQGAEVFVTVTEK